MTTNESHEHSELVLATLAERPDLAGERARILAGAWPGFVGQNEKLNRDWEAVLALHPDLQLAVYSRESNTILGMADLVPFSWDGNGGSLPDGVDDAVTRGLRDHAAGAPITALSALQIVVASSHRGQGLSRKIIELMRMLAKQRGLVHLLAPVRPTHKSLYPTIPMHRYIQWTRPDGLPLDPWLRVHRRLGASVVRVAPRSSVVTGTVAQWESWTGLAFPETGAYVVPGALDLVHIDRERDVGRYEEPNVWMHHRLVEGT
ncbi:MAG TPA: GNAT family N-acetyltransferase [Haliangium sp.]|nr:GNAT family N-acetyltransferase [Haliangium sp.]